MRTETCGPGPGTYQAASCETIMCGGTKPKRPRFSMPTSSFTKTKHRNIQVTSRWNSQAGLTLPGRNLPLPSGTYFCTCYTGTPEPPEVLYCLHSITCGEEHWPHFLQRCFLKGLSSAELSATQLGTLTDSGSSSQRETSPENVSAPWSPFPQRACEPLVSGTEAEEPGAE